MYIYIMYKNVIVDYLSHTVNIKLIDHLSAE